MKTDDDTTLTSDAIVAKVAGAYLGGLRRCYNLALQRDPSSSGVVTLKFSINETG